MRHSPKFDEDDRSTRTPESETGPVIGSIVVGVGAILAVFLFLILGGVGSRSNAGKTEENNKNNSRKEPPKFEIPEPEKNKYTEGPLRPDSPLWASLRDKTARKDLLKSIAPKGNMGNTVVENLAPEGGLLIGFHCSHDAMMNSIQPIYLTSDGEKLGPQWGRISGTFVTIKAKAGYAVGTVNLRVGDLLDGISLVFMKVGNDRMISTDSYKSAQIGGNGGEPFSHGANGEFIVGVHSRTTPTGVPATLGIYVVKP